MKLVIFVIYMIALGYLARADDVDRNSPEFLKRPHIHVRAIVQSIALVKTEVDGLKLMAADLKISKVLRIREFGNPDLGRPIKVYYKTGIIQRPALPELEAGKRYSIYIINRIIDGKCVQFVEFKDDAVELSEE